MENPDDKTKITSLHRLPQKGERIEEKLNMEQRLFMLRLFAEGYTAPEIVKSLDQEYHVLMSTSAILASCRAKRWQPYVEKLREEYLAKVKAVPIANKRVRIDDLEKSRVKLVKLIERAPLNTKANKAEFMMLVRRLNETICVARDEMENKPHMIQQISLSSFSQLSDEELRKRRDVLIAKATGNDTGRNPGIGIPGEGEDFADIEEPA